MADDLGESEMPTPQKQATDLLAEAHEDRIQRLEQVVSETATKVAGMEAQIDAGFSYLGLKIDDCVKPLAEKITQHIADDHEANQKMSVVADHVTKSETRLEKLEDNALKRKNRIDTLKKGLWAIALAAIGALFKSCLDHMK